MNVSLSVMDIGSYLAAAGWERDSQDWRGASIWRYPGEYEVLVPARDDMRDGERRIREILRCLSAVENRPPGDIALDISRPQLDRQLFRTFPANHDSGYISLPSGLQVVQGVRNLLAAVVRTVVQGPHFAFEGRAPTAVGDVLRAVELGPSRAGSYVIEIRLSTDATARAPGGDEVAGRTVVMQMLEAVNAAHTAVQSSAPMAFEDMVTAGVSADFCRALSDFSGSSRNDPFEITFRWARSQRLPVSSQVITFPENAGSVLHDMAGWLRDRIASGPAWVTGVVEALYDDVVGDDRWRIKVRGELRTEHIQRSRRGVWVRLADQAAYERAIDAHRERRIITFTGELSSAAGRVELVPREWLEF